MLVTRVIGVGVPRALLVFFELEGVSLAADDAKSCYGHQSFDGDGSVVSELGSCAFYKNSHYFSNNYVFSPLAK